MPHTLEYNYSLPSPTSVPETQVAAGRSIPGDALDPWYFNTVAAPMLQDVKAKDEMDIAAPGIDNLFNPGGTLAARSGVPPYFFLDVAGPSAPPAVTPAPASSLATRAEAAARMKAKALSGPPPAETLLTPML